MDVLLLFMEFMEFDSCAVEIRRFHSNDFFIQLCNSNAKFIGFSKNYD